MMSFVWGKHRDTHIYKRGENLQNSSKELVPRVASKREPGTGIRERWKTYFHYKHFSHFWILNMVTYHLFIWNKFKIKNYLKKINDLLSNLIQGLQVESKRSEQSLSDNSLFTPERKVNFLQFFIIEILKGLELKKEKKNIMPSAFLNSDSCFLKNAVDRQQEINPCVDGCTRCFSVCAWVCRTEHEKSLKK